MNLSGWVALIIGMAGAVAGLAGAFADEREVRTLLVSSAVALIGVAVLVAVVGPFVPNGEAGNISSGDNPSREAITQEVSTPSPTIDVPGRGVATDDSVPIEDPSPTVESSSPPTPAIRNEGPLTLSVNGPLHDLDAVNPQWGPANMIWSAEVQPAASGGLATLEVPLVRRFLLLEPEDKGSYEVCRDSTGYESGRVLTENLKSGRQVCVVTSDRRISLLTIKKRTQKKIFMDVATWEKEAAS